MATLTKDSSTKWTSTEEITSFGTTTFTFSTGGTYVDKNIELKVSTPAATYKVADAIGNADWTQFIPVYEVDTAGFVSAGTQGELDISWVEF